MAARRTSTANGDSSETRLHDEQHPGGGVTSRADVAGNRILARLSREDSKLLKPSLEPVELAMRAPLAEPNEIIEHVYLLDEGVASVVAYDRRKRGAEVGLIGPEGVIGLPIILGADRSPHAIFMQVPGSGWRLKASVLRKAMDRSATLRRTFLHVAHVSLIQTEQTALANARCTIPQRLARWLLMAQDRTGRAELPLTHELLSIMLGVRRPGVTLALRELEHQGLIRHRRGIIEVLDRGGLRAITGGAYGAAEAELRRLFD